MATKKAGSKKQVKSAVKSAMRKQTKTDAVDSSELVNAENEQEGGKLEPCIDTGRKPKAKSKPTPKTKRPKKK